VSETARGFGAESLGVSAVPGHERGGWSDLAPHPVRRWIARAFDANVTTALAFTAFALPFALLLPGGRWALPVGIIGLIYLLPPARGLATAILNALLLRGTSTTPGKWLCGVRIVRKDGGRLTFGLAFRRELEVFVAGCAFYLPLIALVALGFNFLELRKKGATSWDERRHLIALQRPNSARQFALALLAFTIAAIEILAIVAFTILFKAAKVSAAG
jgi:uncharacterized RDD family membrane protein YckC